MSKYFLKLQEHYVQLLQQHGSTFRAVDWGSSYGQKIRFQVLLEVADVLNTSLLDIGCGVGHLVEYLEEINFRGQYLGIDVLAEMIASASISYPKFQFRVGNILEHDNNWNADYVLGSGLFTFANNELMQKSIKAMFDICNKAVVFNSLSSWAENKEPGEFYADPLTTLKFCRTFTPRVTLRHDYLPHDFTIYMYRESDYK
ncbi:class I SAM-dependent methyltransferase [Nostoc sp. ChiVER01]|uniref:class I SAM-dependent methyltransferase n=1 Tax=Nostoc sp. ChiVER01 TaxID=3075382 RepID=UPI002AD1FF8F|nr:class I SAM-dependent methyltransferase [Nostoc sp. ChiVER01]MDZ8221582.1 class I SAM-dependent methyltransferase [Nostoc sp. ChiVER01]